MNYSIKDGSLFVDVDHGDLKTGKRFSWDEFRALVLMSTRFATGRNIQPRPLKEVVEDAKGFIDDKNRRVDEKDKRIKELENQVNNLGGLIESLEDQIGRQNRELNENRKKIYELQTEKIQVSGLALEQAGEALRIKKNRYEEGLEKTSDLLYVETQFMEQEMNYYRAVFQLNYALEYLRFLTR